MSKNNREMNLIVDRWEFLLFNHKFRLSACDFIIQYRDVVIFVITFNCNIECAIIRETCDDINELVDRADQAMYYSKTHGRGLIVIDGREEEASA